MHSRIKMVAAVAASLLATTMVASAQSQTDSRGNAMGSERVGNGVPTTRTPGVPVGTVGANGANHPTPSSSQGDVGPEGNNNGTRTPPSR
jgi:hypothetical protein